MSLPARGSGARAVEWAEKLRALRRLVGGPIASLTAILATSALSGTALAADQTEFWPELSAFVRLDPRTRLYFDAAYAKGKESFNHALDMAAYVDVTLKPIQRPVRQKEDWVRDKYLWARIGYDHVFKAEGGVQSPPEYRGIVSLYARAPLPQEVWLEGRARADLRWINDDYSTRYRLRIEANRQFILYGHPVTPYFNVEWFYDTKYDGWSRILYQLGPEVTLNDRFRFELYVARQNTMLPREESLNAVGVVAKWYF